MPTLEELTAELDETTVEILGDTILYTPFGGATLPAFKAWVEYGDEVRGFGGAGAVAPAVGAMIRKSDVAEVGAGDVIELPLTGASYRPRGAAQSDKTGRWWIVPFKLDR